MKVIKLLKWSGEHLNEGVLYEIRVVVEFDNKGSEDELQAMEEDMQNDTCGSMKGS